MERPSKPVCYMEGEAVADKDVFLKCRSSQGTPPLKYRWAKTSGNQMLPRNAFVDTIEGDLYLGKDCEITLSSTPPQTMSYGHGYTAAAVVTVAVGLIAIIAVATAAEKRMNRNLAMNWSMNSLLIEGLQQ